MLCHITVFYPEVLRKIKTKFPVAVLVIKDSFNQYLLNAYYILGSRSWMFFPFHFPHLLIKQPTPNTSSMTPVSQDSFRHVISQHTVPALLCMTNWILRKYAASITRFLSWTPSLSCIIYFTGKHNVSSHIQRPMW